MKSKMIERLTRRAILSAGLRLPLLTALMSLGLPPASKAADVPAYGPPEPFDFERAKQMARGLASSAYDNSPPRYAALLEEVDYDAARKITYREAATLWRHGSGAFPVQMFHLGRYAKDPVRIFQVSDGVAREVLYERELFIFGDAPILARLPTDLGFAGFRVMERDRGDWLAIQGASYFRTAGDLHQYGASARGIAINTVGPTPEEFPRFTQFWLEEPADQPNTIVINALMDGPSIAGAYRMIVHHEHDVVMDIEAALYPRQDIANLGVAPLTSMYWYSESNRRGSLLDWRPEIHDSDGLALLSGNGERIWRPLNDPARVQTSTFFDINPRGFGLLQRDHDFNNYQDDGANYHRRPSIWIEPKGEWGEGAVQLVEIPTDDEIHDNIVAYWLPKEPVRAGSEHLYAYRMTWAADQPDIGQIARVVATRIGVGGVPGQPRPVNQRKFMIDFAGGPLDKLGRHAPVKADVTTARGRIVDSGAFQVVDTKIWRAFFDLEFSGEEPIDLRLFLAGDSGSLTETWLYQFLPTADAVSLVLPPQPPSPKN